MDDFTNNGLLETNLEKLHRDQVQDKNKDITILVIGNPGTGKSALTLMMSLWAKDHLPGVTFTIADHIAYMHEPWIEMEREELEKRAVSWYDEGRDSFYRRKAMSNKNTEAMNQVNMYRFMNYLRFINFQKLQDMETQIVFDGATVILRCVKQGWVWAYGPNRIQKIEIGDTVDWPEPGFRFSFPNPEQACPDMWRTYVQENEEQLEEAHKKEKESSQRTVTCQKCEHVWSPRVDVPRQCPECMTRHWNKRVGR